MAGHTPRIRPIFDTKAYIVSISLHESMSLSINGPSHISHNAPVLYPTMYHYRRENCTLLLYGNALWDVGQVHCGICEIGLLTWFISYSWVRCHVNSLAPGGFENIFQNVFFKLISWIDTLSNSCETALRSMPQNPSDDKSTLVQVMAWCRQAASHYLSQCCPKSLSPYGVTRPQWVKLEATLKRLKLFKGKFVCALCIYCSYIFHTSDILK